MNATFSLDTLRAIHDGMSTNVSAPHSIELAAALVSDDLTNGEGLTQDFTMNSVLFVQGAPSPLGSGDVASNFRYKHDKTINNEVCSSWMKLIKCYSEISKNPIYITSLPRSERKYTMKMSEEGNVSLVNNFTSEVDTEFSDLFKGFLESFKIQQEQMKVIREASKGAKYNTYFADIISLVSMVNGHFYGETKYDRCFLKPTIIKSEDKDDSGKKLLQPVKSSSGREWKPTDGHDYLYFQQSKEGEEGAVEFALIKDGSVDMIYDQVKELIDFRGDTPTKKLVRRFFCEQGSYSRWSDYWVNDVDDALTILAIINSFRLDQSTESNKKILTKFEGIAKPWFEQLQI